MRSYAIEAAQGRTTLVERDVPVPAPAAGQVLVRVRAAGLNRGEFIAGHGLHAGSGARPAGNEAAGEISTLGEGVAHFAQGERVMGRASGGFAEFALMDALEVIRVPEGLSWEEAAAVPLVFAVVHDMLIGQGRLAPGEWLLVTGISSGVGVAALQVAKALGAAVIGTSGSHAKLQKLKTLGLDAGICTRSGDFSAEVMRSTGGRGANLVVNTVGGSMFAECIRSLAFEGRFATVGYVDNVLSSQIDIEALHSRRLVLFGVSNKLRKAAQRAVSVRGLVADILPFIASGRIRPVVDRVFSFDELPAAKAYMESNAHLGKIVVRMD